MNKYSGMDLSQLDDEVSDCGTTSNSVEDLRDLAVAAQRRLADAIEKSPAVVLYTPDDARVELALARRRMRRIDGLYFGERHPPIEFSPGGSREELQEFLAEGDPYVQPVEQPKPVLVASGASLPF